MEGDMVLGGGKRSREDGDSEGCCLGAGCETESCSKRARMDQGVATEAEMEDLISRMPELIQDRVFGFLGVRDKVEAAQVRSSWREAVYRPCQWKEVKVRLRQSGLSEEGLSSWKERKIRHVDVYDFPMESETLKVLHDWSGLASLEMMSDEASFDVLKRLFCKDFLSLKKLHATLVCEQQPVFHEVLQHVPNLENFSLDTDECGDLDEAIGRNLKGLKHLSLNFCDKETFNVESLSQLGSLQALHLEGVTLLGVHSLTSSCKNLKELSLDNCDLGTTRWPKVLSQMSSLEELKVLDCRPEVEDGMMSLSQGLKNLKVLKCDMSCGWPLHYSENLRPFVQMSTLQELNFDFYVFDGGLTRALSLGLKSLRCLRIAFPEAFSAEAMKYIARMSSLEELCLTDSNVDGSALKIIREGSCQLRRLELQSCSKTRGEHMRHVAGMSSLRELSLSYMELGCTGLSHLTQGTFRLEVLDVCHCGFSVQDVKLLLEKQQSLRVLRASGCRVTEDDKLEIANLRKSYPNLRDCCIR